MVTTRSFKKYSPARVEHGTPECRGYLWSESNGGRIFSLMDFYNRQFEIRDPYKLFESAQIIPVKKW